MKRILLQLVVTLTLAGLASAAGAQVEECGSLRNHYGPWDYRTAPKTELEIVESAHFTRDVETLRRGSTSMSIGADISYTLRVFPNHHRALVAMTKLARREGKPIPAGSQYSINCWFVRAIQYQPNDAQVRVIYGIELLRAKKTDDAVKQFEMAQNLAGDDANVHYNLGLAYFDLKEYDKSLEHAKKAYELGFTLPGLKSKLQKTGKWRD